jgi:hypothetical protein
MMKVKLPTTEERKKKTKCMEQVLWQELISWSPKRAKKNALILDMLDIAHSTNKKEHVKTIFNFFNC